MKFLYRFIIVLLALCTLNGCQRKMDQLLEQIAIEGVEGISGSPLQGMVLSLNVRNDSSNQIQVQSGEAKLYYMDNYICMVQMLEPFVVPKHHHGPLPLKLSLSMDNPLKGLMIIQRLGKGDYSGFTCTLEAKIKIGALGRCLRLDNIQLDDLLKKLGIK